MNLLYCHDNTYFHSEMGEVYSAGQFPYEYFKPFIDIFGSLTVVGRGQPLDRNRDIQKLNVSMGPSIDFELMPNINSPAGLLKHGARVDAKLKKLVAEADAVIIRAVSDLGWMAYRHAHAMGKPIAMEMAACAWDSTWNHGSFFGKPYAPVRYFRDKIITANASHVIYVSRDFLQRRYKTNGHTAIASNVRINDPDPAVLEKRLARIAQRKEDDLTVIGIVGTLGHRLKGIHTALHALQQADKMKPGRFIFRILGPGNPAKYRDLAIKLGLGNRVFFDGVIQSGFKVLEWLDDVDLYIQPSFQEGVPRATIEAMSRGCPVIGSTAGGIPELLPPEWLHRPGDDERLGALIDKMLEDPALQAQAALRNFETSKGYAASVLMPVRRAFWEDFSASAQSAAALKTSMAVALPS